MICNSQRK